MYKIISQDNQNRNLLSTSAHTFLKRFHVASALKAANAHKHRGIPVFQVFQYLFLLVFSNRSMYMSFLTGKPVPSFGKDTVYRFLNSTHVNWIRFTSILSARIISSLEPLTGEDRTNVFVIDDSTFERNRSHKVEMLTRIYDHAKHAYRFGFRMLTLGWTDGNTFLPVNSILLSSPNPKSRITQAHSMDKRSSGYKRRCLALYKATDAMLELLRAAKASAISSSYVLFDSWFTSPQTILQVKKLQYHVIAMVKKTPKMFFGYEGEEISLPAIYSRNRKRRGRSKYLLSVLIEVRKGEEVIPAKVVYVRNRNKRKEYLCLISTNTQLNEEEIIRLYGKRWDIEVFFKVCKSYLRLSKECRSLSYDSMTAHTAVVFTRYMMLAVENRQSRDLRTLGELFFYVCDELSDLTWTEGLQLLLESFVDTCADQIGATENLVQGLLEHFMQDIPKGIRQQLCVS